MTPSSWTRRAGAAIAIVAATIACRPSDESGEGRSTGEALYSQWDCALCHGTELEGNELGPGLGDLADRWAAEDLADYLRDPRPWHERRPRLLELQEFYPEARMPRYDKPEPERIALARWLLDPADED